MENTYTQTYMHNILKLLPFSKGSKVETEHMLMKLKIYSMINLKMPSGIQTISLQFILSTPNSSVF